MKKKQLYDKIQYKDRIYQIYEEGEHDGDEILIWENDWRDDYWKNDNDPDSEYNKMMELEKTTNFYQLWDDLDYWFEHRIIERDIYGNEKTIKYNSLLLQFINT